MTVRRTTPIRRRDAEVAVWQPSDLAEIFSLATAVALAIFALAAVL